MRSQQSNFRLRQKSHTRRKKIQQQIPLANTSFADPQKLWFLWIGMRAQGWQSSFLPSAKGERLRANNEFYRLTDIQKEKSELGRTGVKWTCSIQEGSRGGRSRLASMMARSHRTRAPYWREPDWPGRRTTQSTYPSRLREATAKPTTSVPPVRRLNAHTAEIEVRKPG